MKVKFEASFEKDLLKIKDKQVLKKVRVLLETLKQAESLSEIAAVTKLKGYTSFYRIRIGNYRLGFELVDNALILTRILHRKEIYRYFP